MIEVIGTVQQIKAAWVLDEGRSSRCIVLRNGKEQVGG